MVRGRFPYALGRGVRADGRTRTDVRGGVRGWRTGVPYGRGRLCTGPWCTGCTGGRVRAGSRTGWSAYGSVRPYVGSFPYASSVRQARTPIPIRRGAGPSSVRGRTGVRAVRGRSVRTARTAYPSRGPVRTGPYGAVVYGQPVRRAECTGVRAVRGGSDWTVGSVADGGVRGHGPFAYGAVRGRTAGVVWGWAYGTGPYGVRANHQD